MTGLTIASGIGRTILVLLELLFSNEQDLLLQCVLLGTTGWFYPRCLLLPRGTKPQAWGDRRTSRMVSTAPCSGSCCLRNPGCLHHRCFLAACRPWPSSAPIAFAAPVSRLIFGIRQREHCWAAPSSDPVCWTTSLPSFTGKGLQNTLAMGHRERLRPKKLSFSLSTVFPGLFHALRGLWGCILVFWSCSCRCLVE